MQNLLIFQPRRTNCILRGLTPTKTSLHYAASPKPPIWWSLCRKLRSLRPLRMRLSMVKPLWACCRNSCITSHYIHDFLIIALWVNERVVNSTHTSWLVDNKFVHLLCGLWRWNRHTMLNRMWSERSERSLRYMTSTTRRLRRCRTL